MASYALLQAYTGVRYDAVTKTLYVRENNVHKFRTFLSTASGYGTVEVDGDAVKVTAAAGVIEVQNLVIM
jgi:hypothetical protein